MARGLTVCDRLQYMTSDNQFKSVKHCLEFFDKFFCPLDVKYIDKNEWPAGLTGADLLKECGPLTHFVTGGHSETLQQILEFFPVIATVALEPRPISSLSENPVMRNISESSDNQLAESQLLGAPERNVEVEAVVREERPGVLFNYLSLGLSLSVGKWSVITLRGLYFVMLVVQDRIVRSLCNSEITRRAQAWRKVWGATRASPFDEKKEDVKPDYRPRKALAVIEKVQYDKDETEVSSRQKWDRTKTQIETEKHNQIFAASTIAGERLYWAAMSCKDNVPAKELKSLKARHEVYLRSQLMGNYVAKPA